jgi:hypothetical protein
MENAYELSQVRLVDVEPSFGLIVVEFVLRQTERVLESELLKCASGDCVDRSSEVESPLDYYGKLELVM